MNPSGQFHEEIISLNPSIAKMKGVNDPAEQFVNCHRIMTAWLLATMMQQRALFADAQYLKLAADHLSRCNEMPTFKVSYMPDGSVVVRLASPDYPKSSN